MTSGYKSLLAEKQALEITLKALKGGKSIKNALLAPTATSSSPQSAAVSDASASESETSASNKAETISPAFAKEQDDKIAALTSNIQLILDNKSKLESGFQAERKKLRVIHLVLHLYRLFENKTVFFFSCIKLERFGRIQSQIGKLQSRHRKVIRSLRV